MWHEMNDLFFHYAVVLQWAMLAFRPRACCVMSHLCYAKEQLSRKNEKTKTIKVPGKKRKLQKALQNLRISAHMIKSCFTNFLFFWNDAYGEASSA